MAKRWYIVHTYSNFEKKVSEEIKRQAHIQGLDDLIEDVLVPTGRKGKRGTIGVALRFHLGPHIELAQGQDGLGVTLALPDGSLWQFRSGRDPVTIEESIWADGLGRPIGIRQLVVAAKVPRSGETFSWLLKKMR